MALEKIAFVAGQIPAAEEALARLVARYGNHDPAEADVVVALGGDGFMLQTLHASVSRATPIYGMNKGTVGFLMNAYDEEDVPRRIAEAGRTIIHPLRMVVEDQAGEVAESIAINEVALLRQTRQAAHLGIAVDGKVRLAELICDGALVATPAGSTAYNLSAHGPILPLNSRLLALTPISAFRPRRWRGALLSSDAKVTFEIHESSKRPVSAVADDTEVRDARRVDIAEDRSISLHLLFDAEHGLEERILNEQFIP